MATTLNANSLSAIGAAVRPLQRLPASANRNVFARSTVAPRQGLLNRLFAALIMARQRQARREIARYLATTGGKMTDS